METLMLEWQVHEITLTWQSGRKSLLMKASVPNSSTLNQFGWLQLYHVSTLSLCLWLQMNLSRSTFSKRKFISAAYLINWPALSFDQCYLAKRKPWFRVKGTWNHVAYNLAALHHRFNDKAVRYFCTLVEGLVLSVFTLQGPFSG